MADGANCERHDRYCDLPGLRRYASLAHGSPNYFFSAGAAVFCYSEAICVASGKVFKPSVLRMRWLVFALMFSLFAVGAAVEGGSIGVGGAILSMFVANFWCWLVVKVRWSER